MRITDTRYLDDHSFIATHCNVIRAWSIKGEDGTEEIRSAIWEKTLQHFIRGPSQGVVSSAGLEPFPDRIIRPGFPPSWSTAVNTKRMVVFRGLGKVHSAPKMWFLFSFVSWSTLLCESSWTRREFKPYTHSKVFSIYISITASF